MTKLHLDFETRSKVDLKKVGAWAYALHPTTEILCMGWALEGDAPTVCKRGMPEKGPHPKWLAFLASQKEGVVSAHNVQFEYAIYNLILHKKYAWPALWDPKRWSCTMARAAMCGLPHGLDALSRVLGCKTPKDLNGRAIMLKMCKPQRDGSWLETPEAFKRLYEYNRNDVIAEMEVDRLLPELSASEREIWKLDLIMNRHGLTLDLDFAYHGARTSDFVVKQLNARLKKVTKGALEKASQVEAIKRYLRSYNIEIPTKYDGGEKKETLDRVGTTEILARPNIPEHVRKTVEIRRQVSKKTSVAKYEKALEMACPDGRARGHVQYHGAHTGRWAGRLLQTQNIPQGLDKDAQARVIEIVKSGNPKFFLSFYPDDPMDQLSNALRGLIVASPGRVLVACDFNAIEARGNFWLAGQNDALAVYRRGESPYLEMGEEIYKYKITKKGHPQEYRIAKSTVLGCGFGLGARKFRENIYTMTAKEGNPILLDEDLAQRAVNAFRERYYAVPRLWQELETAAINAVKNPGSRFTAGANGCVLWSMSRDRRFLVCRLPSGRYLWYWKPSVGPGKTPWGATKETLFYWGKHPKTGQWVKLKTYGGALCENVVQAIARDLMAHGMKNVARKGYSVILTVHDEVVSEVGEHVVEKHGEKAVLDHYGALLCDLPEWAKTIPVKVEGYIAKRYRK